MARIIQIKGLTCPKASGKGFETFTVGNNGVTGIKDRNSLGYYAVFKDSGFIEINNPIRVEWGSVDEPSNPCDLKPNVPPPPPGPPLRTIGGLFKCETKESKRRRKDYELFIEGYRYAMGWSNEKP